MTRALLTTAIAAAVTLAALVVPAPAGAATTPAPTVTGPVTGGKGTPSLSATSFALSDVGYVESEYFVAGNATSYTASTPLPSDGKWHVTPAATAPYTTRIVVFRPQDPAKFNGTVIVEWLNVTAGFDSAPDWINAHNALIRGGFAWVGVSAQAVGVSGSGTGLGGFGSPLTRADPARYGTLSHPGDSFSYDIYSQVGELVRHPGAVDPLGGLKPKHVIAAGESQSAFRMVTYVDAVAPLAHVYDGYLIHSRSGSGAALSSAPQPAIPAPTPTLIRDDLGVPVLTFETETDLEQLHFVPATQPDTKQLRLWEVAGTAHADAYTLAGIGDAGDGSVELTLVAKPPTPGVLNCTTPINAGPSYAVLSAAIVQLDHWVRTGKPPPKAPRLRTNGTAIVRDARGNALGGIRNPITDVPVAALSGSEQTGSNFCFLFGTTRPFDAATLAALYPTHAAYVTKFTQAAKRAVRAGFLLQPEAEHLIAAAQASPVPRSVAATP